MQIPYVIDNIEQRLADVLRYLLSRASDQSLDIATAYFSIRGFEQLRHELETTGQVRLLLGDKPVAADDLGMRPDSSAFLRHELNAEAFTERTLRLVEQLIRFLRRDEVEVRLYTGLLAGEKGRRAFLHAKCYLLYGRLPAANVFDPLTPIVGIVGSSNFTGPGLVSNHELNLVHKTLLTDAELDDAEAKATVAQHAAQLSAAPLELEHERMLKSEIGTRAILDLSRWYEQQWQHALDYKEQLIELLENSKFGGREYSPYEIYMKALYTYFKDDLAERDQQPATRSAVELAEFQEDAVRKARRILAQYDGAIVADSVGLGKTWIGKKLLEDYAYHQRQKALVICPASLRGMWERELHSATIAAQVLTQERLGLDEFDGREFFDVDLILVDEAHNFRNKRAKRYQQLELLLAANGRRGRSGSRKKLILLTATPINNNIFDLYNQINLFTGNDRSYFASAGIGDLYKYFLAARCESLEAGSIRIFNLLEEVVIRRTRQFIRRAYPEALIHGEPIRWPTRQLHSVEYDLQAAYSGLYQNIIGSIEGLHLAHYNLEAYKLRPSDQDEFELGRQAALVGIFKSRFLKRLESSIEAFRISIRRSLAFVKTFAEYVQDGIVLDSVSFQQAMRLLEADEEDSDDSTPSSQASALDEHAAASLIIAKLPKLEASKYDRRRLHRALQADIDALNEIWHAIKHIQASHDAKLLQLQSLLASQLNGCKVVIFTYYKDTARYVYQALTEASNAEWLATLGNPTIRRIDSSVKTTDRTRIVSHFAPRASNQPELVGTSDEVQILIATDVLSEGHNLQDCGHLLNYDLHWNPTRMVQRAGRIDRLGSNFDLLHVYNMFPERELEALLGLVRSLTSKIDLINQTGFLDASVLGEVVTPRDFNTLKRIADEDHSVIEEQESFLELASSESLFAELQNVLATDAQRWLTDLDDGIHSGIERRNAKGLFFYFTAPRDGSTAHFWRYYDLEKQTITDNRYTIMQLIACSPDTPRFAPPYSEVDIFAIHDTILNSILRDVQQQVTATVVDKIVAPEQNVIAQLLHNNLAQPGVDRGEVRELRKMLKEPQVGAVVQRLRKTLNRYNADNDLLALLEVLRELYQTQGRSNLEPSGPVSMITRDDLTLVCYEYIYA
ncbi:MAG TPA: helicase [Herpetosiphon sp.]|uniref:Helicase domain protein n=1 Tax=Herpetosiphon aurantiacus (strain ATCC 23779 / DSM 785 / 114-95) TaxID=316274 RepID=A9B068_HERA2|nr:helicase-related protein [Herpetosiphon sp.]ABX05177.1 helicase domain protein [Herpetosiphon aurantiacus DSM 785]HBW51412.1 helicase [Herpetosiphon sp.]